MRCRFSIVRWVPTVNETQIVNEGQPRWMGEAWAELGQREVAGDGDNARILALFRAVGHDEVRHDEVAWCAAFVGATLERAGPW